MEGAKNNLPDSSAMKAANQIAEIASNLTENDVLIVLISGEFSTCSYYIINNFTSQKIQIKK